MNKNIHEQRILILDFGSQYTQLIARRIREIGVYCELWSWDVDEQDIKDFSPNGIILAGGPESVTAAGSPRAPEYVFTAGVPVLGICYGMQTMSEQLGGSVIKGEGEGEFGYAQIEVKAASELFKLIEDTVAENGNALLDVWMSHGDKVSAIPAGFTTIANTATCQFAAIADEEKRFYGVQFHPEVTHTRQGERMLRHFVMDICGCETLWTPSSIIEDAVARMKAQIGDDEVILGLSGGVDSSVVAMLLQRAIGDKLTCVFVDNGLLRLNEGQQVMDMFGDHFGLKIIHVNAEHRFLVEIFDEESKKLKNAKWLAQGTIYPDVIESAGSKTGKAQVIKSHHNVGGLPDDMEMGLVEPLRELFKDEVRKIGLELGLPYEMLYRHPFPGPGLGVRVLGEVKKEYCDLLRRADAIFIEELHKADLYHKVSQAFVVFLPVRSVGVMGDCRKYDWVVSLRCVETIDFMTARWSHLPYDLIGHVSNRIINEIDGISRVVYDVSGKPPATIEWE
jgi:GMP synthase (glutamine-hydrolysing)